MLQPEFTCDLENGTIVMPNSLVSDIVKRFFHWYPRAKLWANVLLHVAPHPSLVVSDSGGLA